MCRLACERHRIEVAVSAASPLYAHGGVLIGSLSGATFDDLPRVPDAPLAVA